MATEGDEGMWVEESAQFKNGRHRANERELAPLDKNVHRIIIQLSSNKSKNQESTIISY
jgi:hypothetical protein